MFAKSNKEKFVEQAHDLAHDLTQAIAPHVERAREELAPRLADAKEHIAPRLAEAREQLAPRLFEVHDHIAPRLADAREELAPRVVEVRERVAKGVATATTAATAAATPVALEARRRAMLAAAALKGDEPVVPVEQSENKRGKAKYVVFAGLLGLGAIVVQKLRGGDDSANWQTSYSPTASPTPTPAPDTSLGGHVAAVPSDSVLTDSVTTDSPVGGADPLAGDSIGATPGESLSDATDEPRPVTTPDEPAEEVDVTRDPGTSPLDKI